MLSELPSGGSFDILAPPLQKSWAHRWERTGILAPTTIIDTPEQNRRV